MDFFNAIWFWGLLGVAGISIPVILHLLNRSTARETDWGAMRFLEESLAQRTRHIRLEDALLLSCRCLLLALLALGLARPFIPPGATVPWFLVLPLILLAVLVFGAGMALWGAPLWRGALALGAMGLLVLAGLLVVFEKRLNLDRFGHGGAQDIAIIIDASASMDAVVDGQAHFTRAQAEARELLAMAPGGSSFGLILGRAVPRTVVGTPSGKPNELSPGIDAARTAPGTMDAPATLRAAIRVLERGTHPAQQIVLFSDAQREGWRLEDPAAWSGLDHPPRVILRRLAQAEPLANLAVSHLELSRDIVGPDRPVRITVTVENTGSLAVTPASLTLEVEGETHVNRAFGSIAPGHVETAVFEHRFHRAGTHALRARLEVEDDLPRDNERPFAVHVLGGLSVLLVEGRPAAPPLERASTFVATALSPAAQSPDARGENQAPTQLIHAHVVSAGALDPATLAEVGVVVLCDVPELPKAKADALGAWVESGGGLLLAPGPRSLPRFYNGWWTPGGKRLVPTGLQDIVVTAPDEPVKPALGTFHHPALSVVAKAKQSDLGTMLPHAYWKLEEDDRVLARWTNGDPLLVAGTVGEGNVVQLAFGLDPESSTLPARMAFLPFLHELVYHLASPSRPECNVQPSPQLDLPFPLDPRAVVLGPDGETRPVLGKEVEGVLRTFVGGDIVPGLWTVSGGVPPAYSDAEGRAPFVVTANRNEGQLDPLTHAEIDALAERVEIVAVDSVGEVAGLLSGNKFGKELWKILVAGVFLLLLAEVALTRWIARRRMVIGE